MSYSTLVVTSASEDAQAQNDREWQQGQCQGPNSATSNDESFSANMVRRMSPPSPQNLSGYQQQQLQPSQQVTGYNGSPSDNVSLNQGSPQTRPPPYHPHILPPPPPYSSPALSPHSSPVSYEAQAAPQSSHFNTNGNVVPPRGPMKASPVIGPSNYGDYASPIAMKMQRGSVGAVPSTVDTLLDPRRLSSKSPLLPACGSGKSYDADRKSARLLYVWLGASTLVLQTTIFITMEDINNRYFPEKHYAFYCHNVFAFSFFVATAAFAVVPSRLLFSLRLLKGLNFAAVAFAIIFPVVIFTGHVNATQVAFYVSLTLVGVITLMSVLLIPIVFSTASAVPGDCSMYAAFGQAFGAIGIALIAVVMGILLSPRKFLLVSSTIALFVHAIAILSIVRLQNWPWAIRRLERLSDAHRAAKGTKDIRKPSAITSARSSTNIRSPSMSKAPSCFSIIRRAVVQLLCTFLATLVSFSLFPSFGVRLGDGVSRGFGVAMVAIFQGSDQIGRHLPEIGFPLPPLPLTAMVLARFGFLPIYYILFSNPGNPFLASAWTKGAVQTLLGISHGWSVASAFRFIPTGSSKYEIERIQFSLSLSNAIGIPCGALLMSCLVWNGVFPWI